MKRYLTLLFLGAVSFFYSARSMEIQKTVVVDFCATPDSVAGALELKSLLSWGDIARYLVSCPNPLALQDDLLEKLQEMPTALSSKYKGFYLGRAVPPVMQNYIRGFEPEEGIMAAVGSYLEAKGQSPVFKAAAALALCPERVAKVLSPDATMLKVLANLHERDSSLRFVLSANWNKKVFDTLVAGKKFDPYLAYFKDEKGLLSSYVSGDYGVAKPDPKFYKGLIEKYDLSHGRCIAIEVEAEHARAAQDAGMHAIVYDPNNAGHLASEVLEVFASMPQSAK